MAVIWSEKQLQAITVRNRSILVSAAAGSGKTAVLVERIVRRILEEENPLDMDAFLVMTFTRAAARQMKERIAKRLESALGEEEIDTPRYQRLKKQIALVDCAYISTIDSFCKTILTEHLDKIELDPAFIVADEDTLGLMREDILSNLMEEEYEKGEQDFLHLVDSFGSMRSDTKIMDFIKTIYQFAMATPRPEFWIAEQEQSIQKIQTESFIEYIIKEIQILARDTIQKIEYAIEICREEDGPEGYLATFLQEKEQMECIALADTIEKMNQALHILDFKMIGRVGKNVDKDLKEIAKGIRDSYKELFKEEICAKFHFEKKLLEEERENTKQKIIGLLRLTKRFLEEFSHAKRERNLVDFNDLEHMALELLWNQPDIANEYREQFQEIYIDEYQDSNYVQEELVRAIEKQNVFMVGDVKQSIYGFRQAKPELFTQKYNQFMTWTGKVEEENLEANKKDIRIDLSTNYRSRGNVLESVNALFYQIMMEALGGIVYDEEAALHVGAKFLDFTEGNRSSVGRGECLLLDCSGDIETEESQISLEARMVAKHIKEQMQTVLVQQEDGSSRNLRYSDIVILLRSQAGKSEEMVGILMDAGIPAHAQTSTGYFDTYEIRKILSFLTAIDNPYKDIDLAGYLRSPIGKMEDTDLARIMLWYKSQISIEKSIRLFDACLFFRESFQNTSYVQENIEEKYSINIEEIHGLQEIYRKLESALEILFHCIEKSQYMKLTELLEYIYESTGYLDYISAMPSGEIRHGNLLMLLEKAKQYMQSGYTGLFDFVRYIEHLKKYNTDYGEASTIGEFDDTVRIMTIHKSKGLEFPIVYLCDAAKRFNLMDTKNAVIIDDSLGIGCDYVDTDLRTKKLTMKKSVLAYKRKNDAIAEELRVLYVAMTRAKEKFIITAIGKDLQEKLESTALENISYSDIRTANSYLDWFFMAYPKLSQVMEYKILPIKEILAAEMEKQIKSKALEEILEKIKKTEIQKENISKDIKDSIQELEQRLYFLYPYPEDITQKAKISLTELRQQTLEKGEETTFQPKIEYTKEERLSIEKAMQRGNAYHRVMELLDYNIVKDRKSLEKFLQDIIEQGLMAKEDIELVYRDKILHFLKSDLGQRMAKAKEKLKREVEFMMGISALELGISQSKELVLLQGIVDAYIEEEENIEIIDYKTDYIENIEELRIRYQEQLDFYAKALEKITNKVVIRKTIWSFGLGKAISC